MMSEMTINEGEIDKALNVSADVGELNKVLAYIDERLEEAGCPLKVQMQIDVATEEIFVNIANYAYGHDGGSVIISMDLNDSPEAVISFIDTGVEFDPLKKQDPDTTLSADERQIGGLGIYMVKKSMDQVKYKRDGDKNILTIHKTW